MARAMGVVFLTLLCGAAAMKSGTTMEMMGNPIRKVVTMLQAMEKKVTADGKKEHELFEKFMCYCKNGGGALETSISDAEAKIPELESGIEASSGQVKQFESDIKQDTADRKAAKEAMAEATAIREKEAKEFADYKAESTANIAASGGAIQAIEKGTAGASFLQTNNGQRLQQMVLSSSDMNDYVREELTAFLADKDGEGYAPQSGEIVGMLKQMKETMEKDLAAATDVEEKAIKDFDGLIAAKSKEVAALSKSIEDKTVRLGELKVSVVEMKEDKDDTEKALKEDKAFLVDLEKNCKTKSQEHEENVKLRGQELAALADTVKVLNDDDALELFKKTLPSASSFLQLQVTMKEQRATALATIKEAMKNNNGRPELNFIALALEGKKVSFAKVTDMINEMVGVLKQEQADDNNKKENCLEQFDKADDKKKSLERSIKDLETVIEKEKEFIGAIDDEIKALEVGIVALDKAVAEATENRKEENQEFSEMMANDSAAKEVLEFAKNRLNKFYNPKLYKAPPKREMSEEDRISTNMGGTMAPTAAPGGIGGTGIEALAQVFEHREAPPPPPATAEAYSKSSQQNNGVLAMIDVLVADLDKEMTEGETAEKLAQEDYEKSMKDAAEKRALDTKNLADKEKAKAETAASLDSHKEEKVATTKDLMACEELIHSLHGECDWLLQYYDVRKEARAGELESLEQAKAVLNGADYSFLETGIMHRRLRGHHA